MSKPQRVGIAWYAREYYGRILETMADSDQMPDTFDDWVARATEVEAQLKAHGFPVLHVALRPEAFLAWCRANAVSADANARCQYAADAADRAEADDRPIRVDLRRA